MAGTSRTLDIPDLLFGLYTSPDTSWSLLITILFMLSLDWTGLYRRSLAAMSYTLTLPRLPIPCFMLCIYHFISCARLRPYTDPLLCLALILFLLAYSKHCRLALPRSWILISRPCVGTSHLHPRNLLTNFPGHQNWTGHTPRLRTSTLAARVWNTAHTRVSRAPHRGLQ